MPIVGENKKITEEGNEKDAFVVSFTNGALEQLGEFRDFFKQTNLEEVVKLAVSFLQQIREMKEREDKSKPQ